MSREVLINTPENVAIEYELAGIGSRFTANVADTLVILFTVIAFYFIAALFVSVVGLLHVRLLTEIATFLLEWAATLVGGGLVLLYICYFVFFEVRWDGQTPGKRWKRLRVIREGGYPVSAYAVALRNLLRLIDILPGFYAIGILSMFLNGQYQRLGDLISGTIVVKQRTENIASSLDNLLRANRTKLSDLDSDAFAVVAKDARELSADEFQAVRHFTIRRRELLWNAQQESAMKIAVPLMAKLNIVPPPGVSSIDYAAFLEYLAFAYEMARRPQQAEGLQNDGLIANAA